MSRHQDFKTRVYFGSSPFSLSLCNCWGSEGSLEVTIEDKRLMRFKTMDTSSLVKLRSMKHYNSGLDLRIAPHQIAEGIKFQICAAIKFTNS